MEIHEVKNIQYSTLKYFLTQIFLLGQDRESERVYWDGRRKKAASADRQKSSRGGASRCPQMYLSAIFNGQKPIFTQLLESKHFVHGKHKQASPWIDMKVMFNGSSTVFFSTFKKVSQFYKERTSQQLSPHQTSLTGLILKLCKNIFAGAAECAALHSGNRSGAVLRHSETCGLQHFRGSRPRHPQILDSEVIFSIITSQSTVLIVSCIYTAM